MMPKSLIQISLFFFIITFLSATKNIINLNNLSIQAKKENKHLLVYFHKFGCGFCEKMQERTLDDGDIETIIDQKFIFVDLGIDDEGIVVFKEFKGTKHDFAKSLEIDFYPSVGFIDGNRSIVYGVVGYRDKKTFEVILQYIYSGAYEKMDLEAFKTQLEFENDE